MARRGRLVRHSRVARERQRTVSSITQNTGSGPNRDTKIDPYPNLLASNTPPSEEPFPDRFHPGSATTRRFVFSLERKPAKVSWWSVDSQQRLFFPVAFCASRTKKKRKISTVLHGSLSALAPPHVALADTSSNQSAVLETAKSHFSNPSQYTHIFLQIPWNLVSGDHLSSPSDHQRATCSQMISTKKTISIQENIPARNRIERKKVYSAGQGSSMAL